MIVHLASLATPLLRLIDPEVAHGIALRALRLGLAGRAYGQDDPRLSISALGQVFANPIGLAAGFDKDAVALKPLARLGFGFVEAGTVTPVAQSGNPRPRLFRLTEDRAVINRMGFNNSGLAAYLENFKLFPRGLVPVGANVGINKTGADPERDYPALIAALAPHADYIVINVSSPNTPGLRDLQGESRLRSILDAVNATVVERPPLLVKLAPDLAPEGLETVVETCVAARVEGLIVSNTTIARPKSLRSLQASQAGGLSGAPLFGPSTDVLRLVARHVRGRMALIGVGGVATGAQALAKLKAGASLVQIYSAFAYEGPALVGNIKRELLAALDAEGFPTAAAAIGADLK